MRSLTKRLLERAGYPVMAVSSGEEALLHFERHRDEVDLLLTDLVMPGMHRRELIDRVAGVRSALPVVCMTGFSVVIPTAQPPPEGGRDRRQAVSG